jgi:hypothetical protein
VSKSSRTGTFCDATGFGTNKTLWAKNTGDIVLSRNSRYCAPSRSNRTASKIDISYQENSGFWKGFRCPRESLAPRAQPEAQQTPPKGNKKPCKTHFLRLRTWLFSLVPQFFSRELVLETFTIPSFLPKTLQET